MTRAEINESKQKEIFKEQNRENLKKSIKVFLQISIFIIIVICSFYSYTTYISTVKIGVREYRITNKKIPNAFNGLKIIQFSDLHYGTTMFTKDIKKMTTLINERKPDIVVFTGDLIDKNYKLSPKEQEKIIKELKKINASLGKYAIAGEEDSENFMTILNQSEFTILKNESELIYKDNQEPLLLVGLSSLLKNEQNIDEAYSYFKEESHNSNIYTISLLHEPDSVDDILNTYNSDLFLAGHSHNGNIRIPFINYSKKYKGAKKYDQDYYNLNDSKLYISSGLGTNNKSNIRLFCRPSINFYRLSNK